jgi:hypothetical protein
MTVHYGNHRATLDSVMIERRLSLSSVVQREVQRRFKDRERAARVQGIQKSRSA